VTFCVDTLSYKNIFIKSRKQPEKLLPKHGVSLQNISKTTRTHKTWLSQKILFFEISNIFSYLLETKKAILGGRGVRGAKKKPSA
jgi:hypothetical protein